MNRLPIVAFFLAACSSGASNIGNAPLASTGDPCNSTADCGTGNFCDVSQNPHACAPKVGAADGSGVDACPIAFLGSGEPCDDGLWCGPYPSADAPTCLDSSDFCAAEDTCSGSICENVCFDANSCAADGCTGDLCYLFAECGCTGDGCAG